ncbi:DMT family transporter [Paraglaciecola sp.]|uniref:DMT family transporter n=1 Tax=Paraglaciecola sp. TaxID=1920173 RepID=UPI0030F3B741
MPQNSVTAAVTMNNRYSTGLLLAMLATCLYAMKGVLVKLIYQLGVDSVSVMALRMFFSLPIYLFIGLWLWRKTPMAGKQMRQNGLACASIGIFGYYLATYLDLQGLNFISSQLAGLVSFSYPTFVLLLNWLIFRKPITATMLSTLVLTYIGILLLFGHEFSVAGQKVGVGTLLALGSALSFAFYMIFSKVIMAKISSGLFTCIAMSAAGICIIIHFVLSGSYQTLVLTWPVLLLSFGMAIGCTVAPSFLLSEAINRIGSNQTAILGSLGPVVTAIMAVTILAEPFSLYHLLGMVFVVLATAGVVFWPPRSKHTP